MTVQLHLPDLPEVPLSLGGDAVETPTARGDWRPRATALFGSALPLILMGLLALGTWWLVKNSPVQTAVRAVPLPGHVPDYTMERFTIQRYDRTGRMAVSIEGQHLRHFPDTDALEIDTVHVRAVREDGSVTLATARQGILAGDGSSAQLLGGAHVTSTDVQGRPIEFQGEHLLADLTARKLRADRPVRVRQGRSEFSAGAASYDEATGLILLAGPARAVLTPDTVKSSSGAVRR
jgi:lipopolysaccharide export system protein LptC